MATLDPSFEDRLAEAFLAGLDLPPGSDVRALSFGSHTHWDSLGHMSLITELEETFGVVLDGDEVRELDTYERALALLRAKDIARS